MEAIIAVAFPYFIFVAMLVGGVALVCVATLLVVAMLMVISKIFSSEGQE